MRQRRAGGHPHRIALRREARATSASGLTIQRASRSRSRRPPLLGRSPHVLYTNIVEPILRWTFAERGYALVHAACLADRGRAFLLTARTDTGKTTTSLKILDSAPYSFLSDDLTLLTPDGTGADLPEAAHHQPAHAARGEDAAAVAPRAPGAHLPEPAALPFRSQVRLRAGQDPPARRRRSTRSSSCSCRRRSSTWSGWCRTWTWRSRRGSRA